MFIGLRASLRSENTIRQRLVCNNFEDYSGSVATHTFTANGPVSFGAGFEQRLNWSTTLFPSYRAKQSPGGPNTESIAPHSTPGTWFRCHSQPPWKTKPQRRRDRKRCETAKDRQKYRGSPSITIAFGQLHTRVPDRALPQKRRDLVGASPAKHRL